MRHARETPGSLFNNDIKNILFGHFTLFLVDEDADAAEQARRY